MKGIGKAERKNIRYIEKTGDTKATTTIIIIIISCNNF